jgi:hypothetical protein
MTEQKESIIGYSGFELFEECYGYDENACFVADTEASARRFMQYATFDGEYRIEPVTLTRIMDDFGSSFGEFAMETNAFARFRAAANEAGIKFECRAVDGSTDVTLVNVEDVKRHED